MPKKFQIEVFGKPGCEKCTLLNKRLDQLLQDPEWEEFSKTYQNVETVDGLVAFAQTECMNPSRIPGFVVKAWNPRKERYTYLPQTLIDPIKPAAQRNLLSLYLGLETDYTDVGKGVLAPKLIKSILRAARSQTSKA